MDRSPNDDRPAWWRENVRYREAFGLPPYEPSKFRDGTYVHEVIPKLETRCDVTIRFMGINTRYPDDWEVRIDGETAFSIGRHRDENGNTVYEISAEEFEERMANVVDDLADGD